MSEHVIGDVADFTDGDHKVLEINGRSIGVYRIDGEFYALLNYCPHQGAPLCKGPVCGTTLESNVYEFVYGKDQEIVRCPWHGWEFDIKTGASLFSEKIRARSYKTRIENGKVLIDFKGRAT